MFDSKNGTIVNQTISDWTAMSTTTTISSIIDGTSLATQSNELIDDVDPNGSTTTSTSSSSSSSSNTMTTAEKIRIAKISLLAVLFVFILCGNVFVMLALKSRKLKMNRMYFFLVHLSIADLITGFFNVLPQLAWIVAGRFYGGDALCKSVKFLQMLGPYLSSYVLVMTSIDRFQAICNPLANNSVTKTHHRSRWLIGLAWLISMICCSPQVFIFSYVQINDNVYECWAQFPEPSFIKLYVIWYTVSVFIVPFAFVTYTHVLICKEIYLNWHSKRQSLMVKDRMEHRSKHIRHNDLDGNSSTLLPLAQQQQPQSYLITDSTSGLRVVNRPINVHSSSPLLATLSRQSLTISSSHQSLTPSQQHLQTQQQQHQTNNPKKSSQQNVPKKCTRTFNRLLWMCQKTSSFDSSLSSSSSIRSSIASKSPHHNLVRADDIIPSTSQRHSSPNLDQSNMIHPIPQQQQQQQFHCNELQNQMDQQMNEKLNNSHLLTIENKVPLNHSSERRYAHPSSHSHHHHHHSYRQRLMNCTAKSDSELCFLRQRKQIRRYRKQLLLTESDSHHHHHHHHHKTLPYCPPSISTSRSLSSMSSSSSSSSLSSSSSSNLSSSSSSSPSTSTNGSSSNHNKRKNRRRQQLHRRYTWSNNLFTNLDKNQSCSMFCNDDHHPHHHPHHHNRRHQCHHHHHRNHPQSGSRSVWKMTSKPLKSSFNGSIHSPRLRDLQPQLRITNLTEGKVVRDVPSISATATTTTAAITNNNNNLDPIYSPTYETPMGNVSNQPKSDYPTNRLTHSTSTETGANVLIPRTYQINRNKQTRLSNPRIHSMQGLTRAKIKTVKITLVVITCYVLCSSPFLCVQLWAQFWPGAQETALWKGPLIAILMLLPNLNSCVNPWIYIYFNPNLITSFCSLFTRKSSSNSNLNSICGGGGGNGGKPNGLPNHHQPGTINPNKRNLIYEHKVLKKMSTNESVEISNSLDSRSTIVRDHCSRLDLLQSTTINVNKEGTRSVSTQRINHHSITIPEISVGTSIDDSGTMVTTLTSTTNQSVKQHPKLSDPIDNRNRTRRQTSNNNGTKSTRRRISIQLDRMWNKISVSNRKSSSLTNSTNEQFIV